MKNHKRTFEIEWDGESGPFWMNADNLLMCLTNYCPNTKFVVRDIVDNTKINDLPHPAREASNSNSYYHIRKAEDGK